jgi:hypothetical protein
MLLLTGRVGEAEDLSQEAFVRVYERWPQIQEMDSPTGYLYRTALNLHRKRLRRLAVEVRNRAVQQEDDPGGDVADERLDLVSSVTLRDQEMTDLVRVVNGLPEGFVHAPPSTYDPSFCNEPSSAGGEVGSGFVLWVSEVGSAPFALWAHVGICGHLGITNGARDGQLTPDLAAALNKPLHAGYVMPGHLVPDPPSN